MQSFLALATMVAAGGAVIADTDWPELPDPLGVGPRQATIDWLQECGQRIKPWASDAEILALYDRRGRTRRRQVSRRRQTRQRAVADPKPAPQVVMLKAHAQRR